MSCWCRRRCCGPAASYRDQRPRTNDQQHWLCTALDQGRTTNSRLCTALVFGRSSLVQGAYGAGGGAEAAGAADGAGVGLRRGPMSRTRSSSGRLRNVTLAIFTYWASQV
jgi:hypothetical protein